MDGNGITKFQLHTARHQPIRGGSYLPLPKEVQKSVTIILPLNAVLGSHRDIGTVMMGVKHTYTIHRSSPENCIHRAGTAAAGKFNTEDLSVWVPKVRPSLSVRTHLEASSISAVKVIPPAP